MEELSSVVNCVPSPQPLPPDIRATDMGLKLRSNILYLVAGVVIQDGKVLLIQECKVSFPDKWYLPSGRMERGESFIEAVKREVLEESGFEFEPEALIAIERMGKKDVRFGFAGRIIGGSLKVIPDDESKQASWFTTDTARLSKELKLRNNSILPLIELAAKYYENPVFAGLPVQVGHVSTSQRLVCLNDDRSELRVLVAKQHGTTRLPSCLIERDTLFRKAKSHVDNTIKVCGYSGAYRECGVLSMEHDGHVMDGFCLTCVVAMATTELSQDSGYEWLVVTDPVMLERLRIAMREDVRGCAAFT